MTSIRGIVYSGICFIAFCLCIAGTVTPYAKVEFSGAEISFSVWKVCTSGIPGEDNKCVDAVSKDNMLTCTDQFGRIKAARAFCILAVLAIVAAGCLGLYEQFVGIKTRTRVGSRWVMALCLLPATLCIFIASCIMWNLYVSNCNGGNSSISDSEGGELGAARSVLWVTWLVCIGAKISSIFLPPKHKFEAVPTQWSQQQGVSQPIIVGTAAGTDQQGGYYGQQQPYGQQPQYQQQQQQQPGYYQQGGGYQQAPPQQQYGGYPQQAPPPQQNPAYPPQQQQQQQYDQTNSGAGGGGYGTA